MKKGAVVGVVVGALTALVFFLWKVFANKGTLRELAQRMGRSAASWSPTPVEDIAKTYQEETSKATTKLVNAKRDEIKKRFEDAFGRRP